MKQPDVNAALCQSKMMPQRGDVSPLFDLKGLLALLLTVLLMAFVTGGDRTCPNESIQLLKHIIQLLGNSSDARLYTPEDFTEACYDSHLECFQLELAVIALEEEEHRKLLCGLITRLGNLQRRKKNCTDPHAECRPCECHPEKPVPDFLSTLQRMLQWGCRNQVVPCIAKQRKLCGPLQ